MSVLTTNNKHWPLALAVAKGKPTIEQHMQALADWDDWFANEKTFHVMRFFDDAESLVIPAGAGKATQEWMAAGVDNKIFTLIKSMMIIVPEDQYDRVKKMNVTKVFKIPGGIFTSINNAFDWLEKQPEGTDMFHVDQALASDIQQTINTLIKE